MIVVPDADQDSTAKGLLASSMGSAGQRCMAASVAVGVADVDTIIDQLVEEAKAFELGVDMGTIVSKVSLDRIISYIDDAEKMGARVLIDGRNAPPPQPAGPRPPDAEYRRPLRSHFGSNFYLKQRVY